MSDTQFIKDILGEDELGAVIRAHIYIEYFTDKIIELVVAQPDKLKPLKLNCDGKVNLLMALGVNPDIKKPLSGLGGLRNKFAHQPNYKLTKSDVDNLYQTFHSNDKELINEGCNMIKKTFPKMITTSKFKDLNPKQTFTMLALAIRGIIVSALNDIKNKNV